MKLVSDKTWNAIVASSGVGHASARLIKQQIDGVNMLWDEMMRCLDLSEDDQTQIAPMLAENIKMKDDPVVVSQNRYRLREYVKFMLNKDDPIPVTVERPDAS